MHHLGAFFADKDFGQMAKRPCRQAYLEIMHPQWVHFFKISAATCGLCVTCLAQRAIHVHEDLEKAINGPFRPIFCR